MVVRARSQRFFSTGPGPCAPNLCHGAEHLIVRQRLADMEGPDMRSGTTQRICFPPTAIIEGVLYIYPLGRPFEGV
jgi:hypothetical protein